MELTKAKQMAEILIKQYGIKHTFKFDNAKNRFGQCHDGNMTISLSKPLTLVNTEEKVKETILHEIAHAIVGCYHGHNKVWKSQMIKMGLMIL